MASIVAPDVVRFSIEGTYLGRPCVNVLDMVCLNQSGPTADRHDSILDAANTLLDAWADEITALVQVGYSFNELSWVDLNSLDGETGSLTSTGSNVLPVIGGGTGQAYSSAVAVLVTKQTSRARGLRQGRLFLAPPDETNIEANFLSSAWMNAANAAFSNFVERITETATIGDTQYFPTVVHTRNEGTPSNPDIVYAGNTQITAFVPSSRVSTQRRRNRP